MAVSRPAQLECLRASGILDAARQTARHSPRIIGPTPFDEQGLRITGDPIQVAEDVGASSTQLAAFSLSAGGVLAHTPGFTTSSRLTWLDREGRALGQLTEVGDYTSFRFSPDEQRLAFTQVDTARNTQDIWLAETARGQPTRFTFDPLNDLSPIWSPDGKRIMFRSDRTGSNSAFERASTGAEDERLVTPLEVTFPTDWSADGQATSSTMRSSRRRCST